MAPLGAEPEDATGEHAMSSGSEVLVVSAAWDAALLANDAEAIAGFMTEDWVYVGPTGPTPKADIVGWIATGRLVHQSMRTVGVPRVVLDRDLAIVTAHKRSSGVWDSVSYTADEWITEVFLRRSRRWLCILSQKCPVAG
jgi:ketosteroid isomerase-like protein